MTRAVREPLRWDSITQAGAMAALSEATFIGQVVASSSTSGLREAIKAASPEGYKYEAYSSPQTQILSSPSVSVFSNLLPKHQSSPNNHQTLIHDSQHDSLHDSRHDSKNTTNTSNHTTNHTTQNTTHDMASLRMFLGLLMALFIGLPGVHAYWRMSCSLIQTGRLDPIISPGDVSAHVHKVSGASNFDLSNTYEELMASQCTSCEIQDDKSVYWTPQLYYQHANGRFEEVPNGGTVVYYLGRGQNRSNIEPFPPGFRMVSGDPYLRSSDPSSRTYSDGGEFGSRLISDRVSFACLDSSGGSPEQHHMSRTDCDNGLRAQIQFPSCWDGRDFQPDQSHVAYMSGIDNGVCPPSHPRQLVHLFFEVLYSVNDINKEAGGRFVFSTGDPTGFGFHADFMNGWDADVLRDAIGQCVNDDRFNGQISYCPPLAKSLTPYHAVNCPERMPIVNEKVKGMLDSLPGCNVVTPGPERAPVVECPDKPTVNKVNKGGRYAMFNPSIGQGLGGSAFVFVGCIVENGNPRTLGGYASAAGDMTIETCTSICKARGYPFAGLEYRTECYCGSYLSNAASVDCSTTPKMVCPGNETEWCGAPNLLTVWKDTSF